MVFQYFDINSVGVLSFPIFRAALDDLVQSGRVSRASMLQWTDILWPVLSKVQQLRAPENLKLNHSLLLLVCRDLRRMVQQTLRRS
jgi:hypothetical protein